MFAGKSDLVTRINSALAERFSKHKYRNPDFSLLQKAIQNAGESDTKDYLQRLKGAEVRKLVERIGKLENQNEQLIYIIHLLFQRVSELSKHIPGSDAHHKPSFSYDMSEAGNKERPADYCSKSKPALTKREMDIFNLLSKGLCAKEIAKILFISEATVITHKRNLKEKFHAKNTVELISNVLNGDP